MKFKKGDKVKILSKTAKGYCQDQKWIDNEYPDGTGYVVTVKEEDFITVSNNPKSSSGNFFRESDLEKVSSKIKKGGIMSLLKKLLKPADALIEKYAMDEGGNLNMNSVIVQQALLNTDDFKKNLVELCKEEEKKEKEK